MYALSETSLTSMEAAFLAAPENSHTNATIGAEELTVISSYQTLAGDKKKKVTMQLRSWLKKASAYMRH